MRTRGIRWGWAARLTAVLICAGFLMMGCQAGSSATLSTTLDTPFYLDGPQQARPPDGTLTAGTRVTLVSAAGSYSQVILPDGRKAYVASDSLQPLR